MAHFSYSLFMSLVHSFWQAGLLLCLYLVSKVFLKRSNPLSNRNILFLFLSTQFFITVSTFFIYYTGKAFYYLEFIDTNLSGSLASQPYIESMAPWISGAYMIVLIYRIMQLLFGWQQFTMNGRSAWTKPSIDLKLFTAVKANEFGIHRKVSLWCSSAIHTPITFGFLKPVILLPVALVNNLTVAETETLILHELTHIKSNDYFLNWLLIICENIFFFNPFIRIITAKIKLEREKNCDTWVLQFNYPALNYAETLLKTARFKTEPAPFFLTAVFNNAQLLKRIRFFTEEKNLQFQKKNYSSLAIIPVLTVFILNIFLVNYIKKDHSLPASAVQKISVANTGLNENVNARFSTNILPADKVDQLSPKLKTSSTYTETALKITGKPVQEIIIDEPGPENMIVPVALEEPTTTREVTLTEENSATGRSVTKVYQVKQENGEWKAVLMWTITETKPVSDSLPYLRDTTTRFYNQTQ